MKVNQESYAVNQESYAERVLDEQFSDRIFSVDDGVVWVSGMNADCGSVARQMARTLVAEDIPCSLVYGDGAARFGGLEFRYGGAA